MGKKREARIARKLEQEINNKQKSARLVAAVAVLAQERTVRLGADPNSIYQMKMTWVANGADRLDAWSWGVDRDWSDETWNGVIHPKLLAFQELFWREIEDQVSGGHHMHHPMECEVIVQEAQDRLRFLEKEEDEIYRFRLGSRRRLWGFRTVNVFELLWYDPTHRIYPTEPD